MSISVVTLSDTLIVEHCNMWIIKFIEIDYSISWLGMHKIVHVIGKLNSSKFVYPSRLFGTKMKLRFIFSVSLSHSPSTSPSPSLSLILKISLNHRIVWIGQQKYCLNQHGAISIRTCTQWPKDEKSLWRQKKHCFWCFEKPTLLNFCQKIHFIYIHSKRGQNCFRPSKSDLNQK